MHKRPGVSNTRPSVGDTRPSVNVSKQLLVSVRQSQARIVGAKERYYHRRITLQDQPIGTQPSHQCHRAYCNPQNERDLIALNILRGPLLLDNVWVCDRGVTHVCTPEYCRLGQLANQGEIVCPLSGMVVGIHVLPEQSSDPDWTPHWKPISAAQHRRETRHLTQNKRQRAQDANDYMTQAEERAANVRNNLPKRQDVALRARRIVETLLYSKVRKRQNALHRQQCKERGERRIQDYVMHQRNQHQLPCMLKMIEIINNVYRQPEPFVILERDENMINLYGTIVCQVWDRVLDLLLSPCDTNAGGSRMLFDVGIRPNVDHVILGTLYMMREGYAPSNESVLPRDPFLAHYLPTQKDLPLFDFNKKAVSPGQTMLRNMYNRAIECKIPMHRLQLDYSVLEQFGYGIAQSQLGGIIKMHASTQQQQQDDNDLPLLRPSTSRYHMCQKCHQRFTSIDKLRDHFCW